MFTRLVLGLALLSATAFVHPALASDDARLLQIIVSKESQSLTVYDGGDVVATSRVSTGKQGHTTPSGIFSILQKEKYHESNIYSNAPMPFMQRLTWSGIALHESNSVPRYPASHGCVRMPGAFAKKLYQMTQRGVHVVIADRDTVPQPFNHPNLFEPSRPESPPLLSDASLRPGIPSAGEAPVQVAMNETRPTADTVLNHGMVKDPSPVRILITRRSMRESVIDVQRLLNQLGYSAGEEDGQLGQATIKAIAMFKQMRPFQFKNDKGTLSDAVVLAIYGAAGKGAPPNGVLMVRQNFKPLFDAPVTIENPSMALGTHFFTLNALDEQEAHAEWYHVSLTNQLSKETMKRLGITAQGNSFIYDSASNALDRLVISDAIRKRIADLLTPGASLTISDTGIGPETGDGTDFITVTHG